MKIDNLYPNVLIGSSGFVGESLLKQISFDFCYRSLNISELKNTKNNIVVCAAPSAKKWYANKFPEEDLENIKNLIKVLKTIKAKCFILISTVDVYPLPKIVYEDSYINIKELHPYGFNRRYLEKFVKESFNSSLIIRLPGLVGNGLKKNALYDLKHLNEIEKIDSRAVFQFYPISYLWNDIKKCLSRKLTLVNLSTEPLLISYVSEYCFNIKLKNSLSSMPPQYDMRSNFAKIMNGKKDYHYPKEIIIAEILKYNKDLC